MTDRRSLALEQHRRGMQLAAWGVLVLSFDALLVRLAQAPFWDIAFWRGLLMALALAGLWLSSAQRQQFSLLRRYWRGVVALGTLYGVNGSLFVASVSYTHTANTVVILSSSALFAGAFSWLILRERVRLRTWLAILASVLGVLLVFAGSVDMDARLGDLLALLLALSMGLLLTLMRRYPELPRLPMVACSGVAMLMLAWPQAQPLSLTAAGYGWLGLMGLVQIPLASILLMNATRHLSSPEVSLFLLIETVLAPLWVWWFLQEPVPEQTLLGALIILTAIALHSWLSLRSGR